MEEEAKPSSAEGNSTTSVLEENPLGPKPQNGTRSKPEDKPTIKPEIWVAITQIVLAIITAITTITVALLSFQPLLNWLQPDPTPTFTTVPTSSSIPIITNTPIPSFIAEPPTALITPILTYTPTVYITLTDIATIEPSPAPVFIVHLGADQTSGRRPLTVKFDARDSIFHESNGTQISCRSGACYYSWRVYSNGQPIGRAETNESGRFEYTFRDKGTYTVTVYVCRGQDRKDCGGNGIIIVVT